MVAAKFWSNGPIELFYLFHDQCASEWDFALPLTGRKRLAGSLLLLAFLRRRGLVAQWWRQFSP